MKLYKFSTLCIGVLFSAHLFAQTDPPAQVPPVYIDFGTANFTPPYLNMAAWTVASMPIATQANASASTPNGNVPAGNLINGAPIGATPGGGHYGNGNGGNGILVVQTSANAASGTTQPVLAINTTGLTSLAIRYQLSLQVVNPRTVGMVLQYRIGTSGSFTDVSGSAVSYTSGSTNEGDADGPSDWDTYLFPLPAAVDNQPVVQLRWAIWRGGAGNSSGIGIDNIAIDQLSVLPVSLYDFNVFRNGVVSTLSWTSGNGSNFSHFEIERSTNGTDYSYRGNVYPQPNAGINYQFNDDIKNIDGTVYYRIKMKDLDGRSRYSDVKVIKISGYTKELLISPNPAFSGYITISGLQSRDAKISIADISGRICKVVALPLTSRIDVSDLPRGSYTLIAQTAEGRQSGRFTR